MTKKSPTRRSKFELRVEELLSKRADLTYEYEKEKLSYTLVLNYIPDWSVKLDSGGGFSSNGSTDATLIILEAKGLFDYVERRKILAVREAHPTKDIRMVFMRDNRLRKGSKDTYTSWCKRHSIPCSIFPELPL